MSAMAAAVILWILRILLLLIVVLLIVPAGVRIIADQNGTVVRLKILFWTFKLPAGKKKEEEKQPEKKETEKKPEKGLREKAQDFGISLDNIGELLRPFGKLIGTLCRTIRVNVLDLVLPAEGGTPEDTGRNTGLMWA
ncbi:MAG: hypothetical protein IKD62_05540, partial [Oscillospiraceae bacterium]|nr:hypothetical protein [Oscillospiraceae bacterium]